MHADCALRRRGGQHNPPGDRRPDQRDLLGDEAADGEPEQVHLAQLQGGDKRDRFPRHLSHGARCRSRGAADARVVEGDDPPACCQRVNQRGIPAVEVAAEVLEQHQRQGAAGLATGVAVGVVDAIGRADGLVRQAGVGAVPGSRGHVSTFLAGPPASGCSRRRRHSDVVTPVRGSRSPPAWSRARSGRHRGPDPGCAARGRTRARRAGRPGRECGGEAVGVFGRDVGVLCGMPDEERW